MYVVCVVMNDGSYDIVAYGSCVQVPTTMIKNNKQLR